MESEHHYELRSGTRSRSQTPLVQNRTFMEMETMEHHYDLRNKSRERSHTPAELSSSRRSGSRSLISNVSKACDQSTKTIAEKNEEGLIEAIPENRSRRSGSFASTVTRKTERRSERQRVKKQMFVNGQGENKEEVLETKLEQKRKSITPKRILTSDYSSEEGEREDPPSRPGSAYEIYKQAGEWWNVFPKTDYTYSQKSQCRYEIAPGVLAMPNMSRRSIHSDDTSMINTSLATQQNLSQPSETTTESGLGDMTDFKEVYNQNPTSVDDSYGLLSHTRSSDSGMKSTIYSKTHVEQFRSHREFIYTDSGSLAGFQQRHLPWSTKCSNPLDFNKYRHSSQVDSDVELDEAVILTTVKQNQRWKIMQWFYALFFTIFSWVNKPMNFLKYKIVNRSESHTNYSYRQYNESAWKKLWKYSDYVLQYVYLLFVKIIFFDSWLLSQVSEVRKQIQKRGSKILWITLLPLLLIAGCTCLPYILLPFSTIKSITEEMQAILQPNTYLKLQETSQDIKRSVENNDLKLIIENLSNRIVKLENYDTYKTEYLLNINHTLEGLRQSNVDVWNHYDEKILELEKKLDEQASNNYNSEIKAIQYELQILQKLYSELKSCCSTYTEFFTNDYINMHIEKIVAGYIGTISKGDLSKNVQNLDSSNANQGYSRSVNGEIKKPSDITDEEVRKIVKEILKIYDADKTGRVDYALESAGGQIISTRCTQRYDIKSRAMMLLGFTLYHDGNNPRTVIQGNPIQPGACWAFQGFPGYLLIKLRGFIYVTGFTIEHASRSILPNGEMRSAPRKFNVWGLINENDPEPVMFGDYEFINSDDNLQYFPVQNTTIVAPYEYVELRVHSNHGQLEYTCLYRFRVHGKSI